MNRLLSIKGSRVLIHHEYWVHSDFADQREFIFVCPGFQFEGEK